MSKLNKVTPKIGYKYRRPCRWTPSLQISEAQVPKHTVRPKGFCSTARYQALTIVSNLICEYLQRIVWLTRNQRLDLWTRVRDSSLVFKTLVDRFVVTSDQKLQLALNSFVVAQASIQQVKSPSGSLDDGTGLSEPRFLPNITADPNNYGRPKRDGPALRAIVLMTYGRWLLANGHIEEAHNVIWPIVRNDLNYVIEFWHQPGIDFWSTARRNYQVDSFFMRMVHYQALIKGAAFAKAIQSDCSACYSQASQILCSLKDFRKDIEDNGFIAADLVNGTIKERNGRDMSTVIASIFSFDPEARCNEDSYQPCSQAMLRNHKELVDQFRTWPINRGIPAGRAVALGRYPKETGPRYQWKEEGMPRHYP